MGGDPEDVRLLSPQDSPPGTGMQGEQIRWRERGAQCESSRPLLLERQCSPGDPLPQVPLGPLECPVAASSALLDGVQIFMCECGCSVPDLNNSEVLITSSGTRGQLEKREHGSSPDIMQHD